MAKTDREMILALIARVDRMAVRLQQAEQRIKELSNRVPTQAPSDNDLYEAERAEVLIDVETVGLDGVPNVRISYGNGTPPPQAVYEMLPIELYTPDGTIKGFVLKKLASENPCTDEDEEYWYNRRYED